MPEVMFNGPSGRIEARYQTAPSSKAPIAIILHPHPSFGGTMNHPIVYNLYHHFTQRGFAVIRFNFRGVGRSHGDFDHGVGELLDSACVLDWIQTLLPESRGCWIAGFSFGAWIGMQLLMRRPEVEGFISIAPPANIYDFSFLAPCPSSGLIVGGENDVVAPDFHVSALAEKVNAQKGIDVHHRVIPGANHFFQNKTDELMLTISQYLDMRLGPIGAPANQILLTGPSKPPSGMREDEGEFEDAPLEKQEEVS